MCRLTRSILGSEHFNQTSFIQFDRRKSRDSVPYTEMANKNDYILMLVIDSELYMGKSLVFILQIIFADTVVLHCS